MFHSLKELSEHWKQVYSFDLFMYENDRYITISLIRIPEEKRNQGFGTLLMEDLCLYADQSEKIVKLTLSTDFGSSLKKLEHFYGKFQFVKNKGKLKNYDFQESHYRVPNEKLGEGDNGIVYAHGDHVLKQYRFPNCIDHIILSDLQKTTVVPRLIGFKEQQYVVMERIYGMSLDEVNPYDVMGKEWYSKLEKALQTIVQHGYLPCDLSFENIFLTPKQEFKIVDVGNFQKINFSTDTEWMIERHLSKTLEMFQRNFEEEYE